MIELNDGEDGCSGNNILDAIDNGRVFSVKKMDNGFFRIRERCDDYFQVYLSKDELFALAVELQELAYSV